MRIIDFHQDLILRLRSPLFLYESPPITEERLFELFQQYYEMVFAAVFPVHSYGRNGEHKSYLDPFHEMINQIMFYESTFTRYPHQVESITSFKDLMRVKASEKTAFLYYIEGLYGLESLYDFMALEKLGMRGFTLTWNRGNNLGSGALDKRDCGLTDFGADVINYSLEHNLLIDLAHLSRKTAQDELELADDQIFASHVGVNAITPHARNLTDELLAGIADRKGVIGLVFFKNFILNPSSHDSALDQFLKHLQYLLDHYGLTSFAFGSNFYGMLSHETIYPDKPEVDAIVPILDFLSDHLSQKELDHLCFKNAENFLKRCL